MARYTKEEMQNMIFEDTNDSGYDEIAWKPQEAGEQLLGEYVEKKEDCGLDNYTFYIIDDGEQRWSLLESTVLRSQFQKVEIGDVVLVKYLGKQQAQRGNRQYNNYKVIKGVLKEGEY